MRAAAHALGSVPRAALALPPAWRRRIGAALLVLAFLACTYWFWFRDSSFVQVHDVDVTGVSGPQARSIRSALEDAGMGQSTLDVSVSDLRAAVADYPVVRSISAQGQFPHKLLIDVDLNLPVGVLQTPAGLKPVAADGLLLPDVPVTNGLPVLRTTATLPDAERVTAGPAFDLIRVVGLAPEPLRSRIKGASFKPGIGLAVELRRGPELRFGDATRLPAKWMAAARVLAAAGARGATYIDLRLPERPAAGGLPTTSVIPLAPAGAPTTPSTTTTTTTATTTTPTATAPTTTSTTTTPSTTTTTTTTPAQTAPTTTTQAAPTPTTGGAVQAPQNTQP
jgi:cell division protein FtsQ